MSTTSTNHHDGVFTDGAPDSYVTGNFGPVTEEVTLTDLTVVGEIPDFLDGRYLRNGPNPIGPTDPDDHHWFLGDGMVHGVRLRDGHAEWYRNRYVRSRDVAAALGESAAPRSTHGGLDFSPNTHVIGHAGKTLALVEGGSLPYELTDRLDTVGPCTFDGSLPGGFAAHTHEDPVTGELHAITYFFGWDKKIRHLVLKDGVVTSHRDIALDGNPMMHDFALTENYVVLLDLPVTLDWDRAVSHEHSLIRPIAKGVSQLLQRSPVPDSWIGLWARLGANTGYHTAGLPYVWDETYPARVGLMSRHDPTARPEWFDVDPCFVFHTLNAYEDGDRVILDFVRHPSAFRTERRGPNEGPPTLDRWTIDRSGGTVREERLDDHIQEFPRMDERRLGARHRYGYAVGSDGGGSDLIFKHDVEAGRTDTRRFGRNERLSEMTFVPSADDSGENDGVLVGYVHDVAEDSTRLAVVDAETLEDVGAVHLPVRIPYGFHGSWIPTDPR